MSSWLVVLGLLLGGVASAAPSIKELNRLYREHYHSDMGMQWKSEAFAEDSEIFKIAEGFYHLHAPVLKKNGNNYFPDFYKYAKDLIATTTYNAAYCNGQTWMAYMSNGAMVICPAFMTQSIESRASNLFHEASHARVGDARHVTCHHGSYQGKENSCDAVFYEEFNGSGYNYQFMYLWWVRDSSSSHELRNDYLSSMMQWLVLNQFNTVSEQQVKKWGG